MTAPLSGDQGTATVTSHDGVPDTKQFVNIPDGTWNPDMMLDLLPNRPAPDSSSPVPFFHLVQRLKTTQREGWRMKGVPRPESISDHMYRMSIITMLCPSSLAHLDMSKCIQMALIHDMAESLVGDITPADAVNKPEKSRREAETMDYLCSRLLGRVDRGVAGQRIRAIWQEYEDGVTDESKFVHDVDKIELLLQMLEYERSSQGKKDLSEFINVAGGIKTAEVRAWAEEILLVERRKFYTGLGKEPVALIPKAWEEEAGRKKSELSSGDFEAWKQSHSLP